MCGAAERGPFPFLRQCRRNCLSRTGRAGAGNLWRRKRYGRMETTFVRPDGCGPACMRPARSACGRRHCENWKYGAGRGGKQHRRGHRHAEHCGGHAGAEKCGCKQRPFHPVGLGIHHHGLGGELHCPGPGGQCHLCRRTCAGHAAAAGCIPYAGCTKRGECGLLPVGLSDSGRPGQPECVFSGVPGPAGAGGCCVGSRPESRARL